MIASLLALAIAAHSSPALAYLSPEDVLLQGQMQYYDQNGNPLPINPRRADQIATQQAQQNEINALNAQNALVHSNDPVPVVSQPEPENVPTVISAPTDQTTTLDPATLRLLQRLENRAQGGGDVYNGDYMPTQSRRPLASSGPEGYATVAVMLFAVVITMIWARRRGGWQKTSI